jgi:hypothetical protein
MICLTPASGEWAVGQKQVEAQTLIFNPPTRAKE